MPIGHVNVALNQRHHQHRDYTSLEEAVRSEIQRTHILVAPVKLSVQFLKFRIR